MTSPNLNKILTEVNALSDAERQELRRLLDERALMARPSSSGAPDRSAMLRMPLDQRRRLLSQQSERVAGYYEGDTEREFWQGGDIVE